MTDQFTFAWTAESELGLGSIMLREKPRERLTSHAYWHAMAARIGRMIEAEDEDDARYILREVERQESTLNMGDLNRVGEIIAFRSEWLRSKIHFPCEGMPAAELQHDPDTLDFLLSGEDFLEEFVGSLYHEPDW